MKKFWLAFALIFILILSGASAAIITKSGTIQTETWETGNTYFISSTVTIDSGHSLTIEPGVVIKSNVLANTSSTINVVAGVDQAVSFLSDGIIVLYSVIYEGGKRGRAIEVLKMRGEEIHRKIVEADIVNGKGLVVYPDKLIKGKFQLT